MFKAKKITALALSLALMSPSMTSCEVFRNKSRFRSFVDGCGYSALALLATYACYRNVLIAHKSLPNIFEKYNRNETLKTAAYSSTGVVCTGIFCFNLWQKALNSFDRAFQ